MESKRLVATVWLVFIGAFFWGLLSQRYHWFPYDIYNYHFEYAESFPEDASSLSQKIEHDSGGKPWRLVRSFKPDGARDYTQQQINGLAPQRDMPRIYLDDPKPAFRLVVGAFDFEGAFWGAVLIDETGSVVHTWQLSGSIPELNNASPDRNKGIYGVDIFPDGSMVFNMDVINLGLVKRDFCSRLEWTRPGFYHHVASASADYTSLWTFEGHAEDAWPTLMELDAKTGDILRTIKAQDIQKKNPELFVFDLRYLDVLDFARNTQDTNYPHHNDIEPLPPAYAQAFPNFAAGDLAINYRTTNLVYVLDPESLKVKFWYMGAHDGGHDADWQPDGTLSVFNNKWRAQWDEVIVPYSTVVTIDPATHTHHVAWDGKAQNVYTSINGRHQITPAGSYLITSAMQGRGIEVSKDGKVIFEFINDYDRGRNETLHLSEVFYLPKDFFNFDVYDKTNCTDS